MTHVYTDIFKAVKHIQAFRNNEDAYPSWYEDRANMLNLIMQNELVIAACITNNEISTIDSDDYQVFEKSYKAWLFRSKVILDALNLECNRYNVEQLDDISIYLTALCFVAEAGIDEASL